MFSYRPFILLLALVTSNALALTVPEKDLAERNSRAKRASLCIGEEVVVFTCPLKEKRVSVCASLDADKKVKALMYRFGRPNKIEVEIPKDSKNSVGAFSYNHILLASAWSSYLRIQNGQYRYYVYSASVRGPDDPKSGASTRSEPSGVVALLKDKILFEGRCSGPAFDHNFHEAFLGESAISADSEPDFDPFEHAFPPKR
jgi:hypothetical protein